MDNLFAILILLFLITSIVGLILIFIKSKRKTGIKLFLSSLGLFIISFVCFGLTYDETGIKQTESIQNKEPAHQIESADKPALVKSAKDEFYKQPDDATAFITTINDFRTKYNNSSNPLAKSELRSDRGKALCKLVSDEGVKNWIGTLKAINAGSNDDAYVTIELDKKLVLKTVKDSSISKADPIFYKLSRLEPNTKVKFSALLVKEDKRPDCFSESSVTENGSMDEPEYAMELKDVSVYHEDPNEQAKIDAEAISKAEEAKKAGVKGKLSEEECRKDIQCTYDKTWVDATSACRRPIEKSFKYKVEWQDGLLTPMFSSAIWGDEDKRSIIFIGDKISAQNGFGAWKNVTYYCQYDLKTNKAIYVEINEE